MLYLATITIWLDYALYVLFVIIRVYRSSTEIRRRSNIIIPRKYTIGTCCRRINILHSDDIGSLDITNCGWRTNITTSDDLCKSVPTYLFFKTNCAKRTINRDVHIIEFILLSYTSKRYNEHCVYCTKLI